MDVAGLAAAYAGAHTARLQLAAAARMLRMNAQAEGAVVKVLEAAQDNLSALAAAADGLGGSLDVLV